jgi:hypothetical protein
MAYFGSRYVRLQCRADGIGGRPPEPHRQAVRDPGPSPRYFQSPPAGQIVKGATECAGFAAALARSHWCGLALAPL